MPNKKLLLALTMAAAASCSTANASVLFSDNFNESGFMGAPDLLNNYSDRWAHTSYYSAVEANGWTFTGRMTYAVNTDNGDGALSLEEPYAGIGSAGGSRNCHGNRSARSA